MNLTPRYTGKPATQRFLAAVRLEDAHPRKARGVVKPEAPLCATPRGRCELARIKPRYIPANELRPRLVKS
jgi:hypothetical protein